MRFQNSTCVKCVCFPRFCAPSQTGSNLSISFLFSLQSQILHKWAIVCWKRFLRSRSERARFLESRTRNCMSVDTGHCLCSVSCKAVKRAASELLEGTILLACRYNLHSATKLFVNCNLENISISKLLWQKNISERQWKKKKNRVGLSNPYWRDPSQNTVDVGLFSVLKWTKKKKKILLLSFCAFK